MVVVPPVSESLFLFLPFALDVEWLAAFDKLSVGVWVGSSDFIGASIFVSSIFAKTTWRKGAQLWLEVCDGQSGHFGLWTTAHFVCVVHRDSDSKPSFAWLSEQICLLTQRRGVSGLNAITRIRGK